MDYSNVSNVNVPIEFLWKRSVGCVVSYSVSDELLNDDKSVIDNFPTLASSVDNYVFKSVSNTGVFFAMEVVGLRRNGIKNEVKKFKMS